VDTIGARIRAWRRRRGGMSQKALADLAGISQGYLSQIESGKRPLDRKSTQVAIASALNISVSQLLGQPSEDRDPVLTRATACVPAIRSTLVELSVGERRKPRRDRLILRKQLREAMDLRNAGELAGLAPSLPDLLYDLAGQGKAMTPELVEALFCTQVVLKNMARRDLSREAAYIAMRVAEQYDSPVSLGQAQFSLALSFPPENAELGAKVAERASNELQGVGQRDAQELYVGLHLMSALHAATALKADDAAAHLDEADDVARSLGEPQPYGAMSAGVSGNWFGPTNVNYWRVSVAAELGDTGTALAVADRVDFSAVPVPMRLVYYWTDMARALAAGSRDREAMQALAKAERAAPQHFRFNPMARELVMTLINRAKRRAVGEDMMALARRLGLNPV